MIDGANIRNENSTELTFTAAAELLESSERVSTQFDRKTGRKHLQARLRRGASLQVPTARQRRASLRDTLVTQPRTSKCPSLQDRQAKPGIFPPAPPQRTPSHTEPGREAGVPGDLPREGESPMPHCGLSRPLSQVPPPPTLHGQRPLPSASHSSPPTLQPARHSDDAKGAAEEDSACCARGGRPWNAVVDAVITSQAICTNKVSSF